MTLTELRVSADHVVELRVGDGAQSGRIEELRVTHLHRKAREPADVARTCQMTTMRRRQVRTRVT